MTADRRETLDLLEALLVFPSAATRGRWGLNYGWHPGDPYPESKDGRVLHPDYARPCRACGQGVEWYRRVDCLEHRGCRSRRRSAEGRLRRAMRATVSRFPERASGPGAE